MKTFTIVILALALSGCQTQPSQNPNLPKSRVLQVARTKALENGELLDKYATPIIEFHPETKKWTASFSQKRPYTPGIPSSYHCFSVTIDDETGTATYEAGKLK